LDLGYKQHQSNPILALKAVVAEDTIFSVFRGFVIPRITAKSAVFEELSHRLHILDKDL
jgi:hypothetical protein